MRALQTLLAGLLFGLCLQAQTEPAIDKDSISVHPVRRGNMPVRLMPAGEILSLDPPVVTAMVRPSEQPTPQVGQKAAVLLKPGVQALGSIADIDRATSLEGWKLTIRLKEPLPADASVGSKVGTLVEVGELKDVVYFEKPGTAKGYTEMPLFVIEPGHDFARRAQVRFGRESGALIQIVSGLQPGDMVIVTDTSQFNSYERVQLK